MTRNPFRCWWLPLLLGPACALALEIGEIQVQSSLNQLFDARIPLPNLTPEELKKVSVKLATAATFKEFGLERTPALANLAFSVEYNAEGQVYVKVVSSKPIQEPSLGLLVEFGWPRGRTYREFTVLLDPVQRLAQRPGDRTKTVLDKPVAASPPQAEPTTAAPAAPPVETKPSPVAKSGADSATTVATETTAIASPAPAPSVLAENQGVLATKPPLETAAVTATPTLATPPAAPPGPGGGGSPEVKSAAETVAMTGPPLPALAAPGGLASGPATPPKPQSMTPEPQSENPSGLTAGDGQQAPRTAITAATAAPAPSELFSATPVSQSASAEKMAEAGKAAGQAVLPVEAPSTPAVRIYRPGDTYGPVAAGEGLSVIALKVRPDPGITRDEMARALFQANPHAFGRAGIGALRKGALLRVPTFREIADLTGSSAARQLAGTGPTPATTAPPGPPLTETPLATAAGEAPEVFSLEPPTALEPLALTAAPPAPTSKSEPMVPALESAEPSAMAEALATLASLADRAPVPAALEPAPLELASLAAVRLQRIVPEAETRPLESAADRPQALREPDEREPQGLPPVERLADRTQAALEPVSVSPLVVLAISEMMATVTRPPAVTAPAAASVSPSEALAPMDSEAESRAPARPAVALHSASTQPAAHVASAVRISRLATPLQEPVRSGHEADFLAAIQRFSPGLDRGALKQLYPEDELAFSAMGVFIELPPVSIAMTASAPPPEPVPSPVREAPAGGGSANPMDEGQPPPVPPQPRAASEKPIGTEVETTGPPPDSPNQAHQYGPVAANERLWDIATKVRPDPSIGKEHMMKALLKANPQAFTKANNMDSLKVGSTLRIPTLREIVDYTGAAAARQLLEQRQAGETMPKENAAATSTAN